MPTVTIRIPGLLAEFADDRREHDVVVTTATEAVAQLLDSYPSLHPHVNDDTGSLRRHLQLYVDGRNVEWFDTTPVPVAEGSVVELFQAVSGG
jgi:molybdopterin converting factor small subunit